MEPLLPNTSYHIYNHANGFENVFQDEENYRYFLMKYRQFDPPYTLNVSVKRFNPSCGTS